MTTYCKSCGRECSPRQVRRASEDYDPPGAQRRQVTDWVSDCCGDEVTEEYERHCISCKYFDGIDDCNHPGPEPDLDMPCPQWKEIT